MVDHIKLDQECYEVFNAFPCLYDVLELLQIKISSLPEGDSVYEVFSSLGYHDEEIDHLLKKLNFELNYFLKTGKLHTIVDKENQNDDNSLDIEMIA